MRALMVSTVFMPTVVRERHHLRPGRQALLHPGPSRQRGRHYQDAGALRRARQLPLPRLRIARRGDTAGRCPAELPHIQAGALLVMLAGLAGGATARVGGFPPAGAPPGICGRTASVTFGWPAEA